MCYQVRASQSSGFPHRVMQRFMSSAASSSAGRAERPATIPGSSSSAEQPATSLRMTERPATPSFSKILSIRDVQRWLAEEPIESCSSADVQRIREAVAVLSRPKPRQEDVEPLQNKWQVSQKKDKKRRRLGDVLQELQGKVIKAAKKLHIELSDSADQLAFASPAVHGGPDIPGAERPDISMSVPSLILHDYKLARQSETLFWREQSRLRRSADKPNKKRSAVAFALLQDCRKYCESNWIFDDEEEQMKKLLELLEILALPHLTSKACRRLYNLSGRSSSLGPFVRRNALERQSEMDHEEYRALAFITTMVPDLVSFFRRRDPLPADLYSYLASLFELLRKTSLEWYGHDVRVQWKTKQDVRELYEGLPRTQDLWLLPDYAEHELDYLEMARYRDRVMGIPVESNVAFFTRFEELDSYPPVCSKSGMCRDYYFHQACTCDEQLAWTFQVNLDEDASDSSDEDLEEYKTRATAVRKTEEEVRIKALRAANLAMGLGPSLPSHSKEDSAEQPADIAMS